MPKPTSKDLPFINALVAILAGVPNRACHEVYHTASCIAQSRIFLDVLDHFGVEAMPLPVRTSVHNDLHMQAIANPALAEIPGQATVRIKGTGDVDNKIDRDTGDSYERWDGHLVVWIPSIRTLFDPTIGQFSHPELGMPLPNGIVLQPPDDYPFDPTDPESMLAFEGDEGQVVQYEPLVDIDHAGWQSCPDWNDQYGLGQRMQAVIIHYVEEVLDGATALDIHVEPSPIAPHNVAISMGPAVRPAPPVGRGLLGPRHSAALAAAAAYHHD